MWLASPPSAQIARSFSISSRLSSQKVYRSTFLPQRRPSASSSSTRGTARTAHHLYRRHSTSSYVLRSGLNTLLLVTATALGLSFAFTAVWKYQLPHRVEELVNSVGTRQRISAYPSDDLLRLRLFGMPGQLLPGRPGTLTYEQEEKLRQLWKLVAEVFGIYTPLAKEVNGNSNGDDAYSPLKTPQMKSPKRTSFFGISWEVEEESPSTENTGSINRSPSTVADVANNLGDDDKYGQNKAFKDTLASMTPEDVRISFWDMVKHDHPDALLLRFLRARKWDIEAALIMAISAFRWRREEGRVDSDVVLRGEQGMLDACDSSDADKKQEGEDFMAMMRMGKSFIQGVDKHGRPVCNIRVRLHHAGDQCESSLNRYTIHSIETTRVFLRPPVDTATIIFDMTDFSLANMDYVPIKFMIQCFEANYPESLGAVLVHRAPWIFQGIWRVIKGWLDPVVAAKVHFTNELKDLEVFIDESNIIKELGGPLEWEYEYVDPLPDENRCMQDSEARDQLEVQRQELTRKYERVVLNWIGDGVPSEGSDDKTIDEQRRRRDEIALQLRNNYWELDPYVRARTLYDRIGVLRGPEKPAIG